MRKILLLPLDERPCNYNYAAKLLKETDFELVVPPLELMPKKKQFGNADGIFNWAMQIAAECYGAIISIDSLVYTGIVPSRLHHLDSTTLLSRLAGIKTLKEQNPQLKIFAFSLIMRCPQYSSSDEEPDYYADFGREIFRTGYLNHKQSLQIATKSELSELVAVQRRIPIQHIEDYLKRRRRNLKVNKRAIDLTAEGIIDFLIIPQDDSSPYGYTARDQQQLRQYICKREQQFNVYMYPDADAVANTLAARMINEFYNKRPMVYIKQASTLGGSTIPSYEDRPVGETIKYQIMAAGGLIASSVAEADLVLMVNTAIGNMREAQLADEINLDYDVNRTQLELVEFADYCIRTLKKPVSFADIAYANGGDPALFELLRIKKLLFKLAGYAGWNTSSNTLGTAIPMGMLCLLFPNRSAHLSFLALRYLEDVGYMSLVRKSVTEQLEDMGLSYFKLDGVNGKASKLIREQLEEFAEKNLLNDKYDVKIKHCCQPWNRMFETEIDVAVEQKKDKRIFVSL